MKSSRTTPLTGAPLSVGLSALVIAVCGVTPTSALVPWTVPAPPEQVERLEGHLWRDVDGKPLPFQSDEEIEEFLRTATVESVEKIPVGVTAPRKVVLAGRGVRVHAAFKDVERRERDQKVQVGGRVYRVRDWRDSHSYDVAAYHLDRLLGLERVPPAAVRKLKKSDGSVKIWLEGSISDKERRDLGCEPPDTIRWYQQRQILHVFDNLVANQDSNLGNTLIDDNWRLWFIDCGRCFEEEIKGLLYPSAVTHCERGLWRALQELDEARLEAHLAPYLTVHERRALLARRDELVQHVRALIDELGEKSVLYDLRPAGEHAPCAGE
jgi:hypothetical protein